MTDDVGTTPRKPMPGMRRLKIFEAAGGICCLCDLKIRVGKKWIVEHKIALVLGGADTDENCGPAHEDCRRIKDKVDVADGARAKRRKYLAQIPAASLLSIAQSQWDFVPDGAEWTQDQLLDWLLDKEFSGVSNGAHEAAGVIDEDSI